MQELEKPKRRFFSCLNCFLSILVLFLLFVIGLFSILAKAGFIRVPLLTPLFFKEPQEVVKPDLNIEKTLAKKFEEIREKIKTEKEPAQEVELQFTQEEVVGFITVLLSKSTTPVSQPQVIIQKNGVEAWGRFYLSDLIKSPFLKRILEDSIWLKTYFLPITTGENVQFEIKKIQIGSLVVPNFMVNRVVKKLTTETKIPLNYEIKGIKKLRLEEGRVIVVSTPEMFSVFESQFKK